LNTNGKSEGNMDKEFLLNKIKEITNCSGSEKEAAFQFLIKNILNKIKHSQAARIAGLGIFQLKNEPLLREERKGIPTSLSSIKTLIYAPFYDDNEKQFSNLFLNIDLSNYDFQEYDQVDNAFNLGFGKPTIPLNGQDLNKFLKKIKDYKIKPSFEETISELIDGAEVLDDFNIFSDYIEKSFLGNQINETEEEAIKSLLSEEVNPESDVETTNNIEPVKTEADLNEGANIGLLNEEKEKPLEEKIEEIEITNESIEKLFSDEELEKVFVEEPEIKEQPEPENLSSEVQAEEMIDIIGEDKNVELEVHATEKSEEDPKRKTMFDKLEDMLTKPDAENLIEEIVNDEESDDPIDKQVKSVAENVNGQKTAISKLAFYKSVIFWFAIVFIIVLAASLYLFVPEYFNFKPENQKKAIAKKEISKVEKPDVIIDSVKTTSDLINQKSPAIIEEKPFQEKNLYRAPLKDIKISNQIFFDGKIYTVQVSSWLNKSIAENEVKKLRSKGFDAFIYEIYVPAKGSTWSRVRIGDFSSSAEAEKFLINNQLKE